MYCSAVDKNSFFIHHYCMLGNFCIFIFLCFTAYNDKEYIHVHVLVSQLILLSSKEFQSILCFSYKNGKGGLLFLITNILTWTVVVVIVW